MAVKVKSRSEAPRRMKVIWRRTFSVKASMLEDKLSARAKQEGQGVHTLQQQPQSAWEKYLDKRKQKKKERKQKAKEDREKLKKAKK